MPESDWLAERFEENRSHLRGVAYRILGSLPEAEDAVQEAWLRLSRSDTREVRNLGGSLTTVVARLCLDMLRARNARREEPESPSPSEPIADREEVADPEQEAIMADSVGLALLAVLDTLTPAERVAFVLHDLFAVPFEDVASIVGRTPTSARQLASRARRRVRGAAPSSGADRARQRQVVDAFLAASRDGDFEGLLAVLDPEVVVRADDAAVAAAAANQAQGAPMLSSRARSARAAAEIFLGRARAAQPALVEGSVGAAWAPGGRPRAVFAITIDRGKIVEIEMIADPERIGRLDVELLGAR
jgi:RNA polymerase sigma-70 factor (ECF subfamily)